MSSVLLQPKRSQWLVMAATLLFVIPAIVYLVVPNDAALVLVRRFELPALQESLGFATGHVAVRGEKAPVFTITAVTPGSPFWQAGVRPGDIPVGYKHGIESGFIWDLMWGKRKGSATLRFLPAGAAQEGGWQEWRSVTVIYPRVARAPAT